eukprot:998838-Pyramimonas_sp.AAC.1
MHLFCYPRPMWEILDEIPVDPEEVQAFNIQMGARARKRQQLHSPLYSLPRSDGDQTERKFSGLSITGT